MNKYTPRSLRVAKKLKGMFSKSQIQLATLGATGEKYEKWINITEEEFLALRDNPPAGTKYILDGSTKHFDTYTLRRASASKSNVETTTC